MKCQLALITVVLSLSFAASAQIALNAPEGITFDSLGNLYVANYGTNQILIYNSALVQTSSISQGLAGPNRLAFDSVGNLYVSNGKSNSITVYDPSGNQITSKTITQDVNRPLGVAVDSAGNVFVANNGANNISAYTADGVLIGTLMRDNHHRFVAPGVMAIYGPNIYIGTGPTVGQSFTNSYNIAFLLTGHPKEVVTYFDTNDEGPTGIAFDSAGNVYIDYFYTGTAAKYSPTNQLLLSINVGHFGNGEGMAVDQQGNIYIAFGNVIYIYDASGKLINTLH
jgi:DNA-binding beta-propeller fold protein YncE